MVNPMFTFRAPDVLRAIDMFQWKVFLGGMFVAAAAISTVGTFVASPAVAALAIPAAAAGRLGALAELIGSVAAGLLAQRLSHKR